MSVPKSKMYNSPSFGNTGGKVQKVSPEETNFPSISSDSTTDRLLNRSTRTGLQHSSVLHGTAIIQGVWGISPRRRHYQHRPTYTCETALNHVSKLRV